MSNQVPGQEATEFTEASGICLPLAAAHPPADSRFNKSFEIAI